MAEGKERLEIGKFIDGKIVPVEPAKHKNLSSEKLTYKKGTGNVDFEIKFVDKDVKTKTNQK